jgi:hypothetical protein
MEKPVKPAANAASEKCSEGVAHEFNKNKESAVKVTLKLEDSFLAASNELI